MMTEFTKLVMSMMPVQFKMFGKPITYKRRDTVIENVPAIPTTADHSIGKVEANVRMKTVDRHYIIESAQLMFDGTPLKPKPGDRIIEDDWEYEITDSDIKQCYRPIDPEETFIRIFVQKAK